MYLHFSFEETFPTCPPGSFSGMCYTEVLIDKTNLVKVQNLWGLTIKHDTIEPQAFNVHCKKEPFCLINLLWLIE